MAKRYRALNGKPSSTLDPETEHLRSLLYRSLDRLVVADDGVQWQATIKQMKDLADSWNGNPDHDKRINRKLNQLHQKLEFLRAEGRYSALDQGQKEVRH